MKTNKVREDVITLGVGHSLMVGNIPLNLPPEVLSSNYFKNHNILDSVEAYGLYGVGIDYQKFAEGLQAEENWQELEFIQPIYRMLSEVIVNKAWNPVDFSKGGVLKNSMPLLVGQSVYTDHWSSTNNVIGSVKNVVWQEAYQDTYKGKRFVIPAGINGTLKLDAVSNPKIARGIMMDPPSIHSNSVTVRFKWDKSHPSMDDRDFYSKIGAFGDDKEMIRKIAVDIRSYAETSLVSNGADPFAKKIGADGKIVLPHSASSNYNSYSEKNYYENKYYFMDLKSSGNKDILHNTTVIYNDNSESPDISGNNEPNKNNNNMKELQKFLESIFGDGMLSLAEGTTISSEVALSGIKSLISDKAKLEGEKTELETKLQTAETAKTELEKFKTENESFIEIGKTHLTSLRDSVKADFIKLSGGEDKADAAILGVFVSADLKALEGFKKTYQEQLEEKYPMACEKCGSHNVSRATAKVDDDEDGTEEEFKEKASSEAWDSIYQKKLKG